MNEVEINLVETDLKYSSYESSDILLYESLLKLWLFFTLDIAKTPVTQTLQTNNIVVFYENKQIP